MTHLTLDTQQAYDLLTAGMSATDRFLLSYLSTEWVQEGYDRAVADGYGKQPEIAVGSLWVDENGNVVTVNAVGNRYVHWGMRDGRAANYTFAEFLAAFKPYDKAVDAVAGAVEEPAVNAMWPVSGGDLAVEKRHHPHYR